MARLAHHLRMVLGAADLQHHRPHEGPSQGLAQPRHGARHSHWRERRSHGYGGEGCDAVNPNPNGIVQPCLRPAATSRNSVSTNPSRGPAKSWNRGSSFLSPSLMSRMSIICYSECDLTMDILILLGCWSLFSPILLLVSSLNLFMLHVCHI